MTGALRGNRQRGDIPPLPRRAPCGAKHLDFLCGGLCYEKRVFTTFLALILLLGLLPGTALAEGTQDITGTGLTITSAEEAEQKANAGTYTAGNGTV